MRNLKKILALVLALVMSLSLMATAGAAETTVAEGTSKYQTATDVLQGLEVIRGDAGGFRYQDPITRAEVAAVLYRIATGDVKDAQASIHTGQPFTDVKANDWYTPYISYCYIAEYIKGNPNGTFEPDTNINGYATLAMILRAMGYGKNGEFEGDGWEIRTASTARQIGILENVFDTQLSGNATRELVAEILFRAMLKDEVKFSALNPYNYESLGTTLGMRNFGLEKVTGVVMANEWANLNENGDSVLAAGTTQLKLEDGKTYTVNQSTGLDAVGLTYNAYVANGEGSVKQALTLEEGSNTVAFNEGKATGPDTDYTANREWATIQKLADEKSISIKDSTEFFVNYDQAWNEDCTSDYLIRYAIAKSSIPSSADDAWNKYIAALNADTSKTEANKTYKGHSIISRTIAFNTSINAEGKPVTENLDCWVISIRPDALINEIDQDIMEEIFYTADRIGDNYWNSETVVGALRDYAIGEVYVGTTSMKDYSDTMSWKEFKAEYFNDTLTSRRFTSAENGESLRVIDNNNDGTAEYVLKITYVQDKVVGTYKDAALLNSLRVADYSGNNLYNPDEIAAGDIVNYTIIDKKLSVWKADVLTDVVKTKHFNNITITTDGGEDKGQSGIDNETLLDENIMMMDEKVEYNMYLDEFGFVRSYELAQGSQYALLTELYPTGNQNYNYVKSFKGIVEMKIGDADIDEYNVANSDGSVFFSDSVWTIGTRSYWGSNLLNYLQPAVAHLGNPDRAFANYYSGKTSNAGVYKVPSWNRIVTGILPQTTGSTYFGVFDYDAINYTGDQNATGTTPGTAPATFSFTNVAAYTMDDENNVTLKSATQLSYDQDGNQMYRIGQDAAIAAGFSGSTGDLAIGTIGNKADLIAKYAKAKGVTEATAETEWWNVFTIYTNGRGIYPVYKVDYVQLQKENVKANTVHYTIDGDYNSLYNTWSNTYVNATKDTEFYIVMPNNIQYKVGFSELPTIAKEKVRAAYAVATNTNANASGRDYWVADVIVIEVDSLEYSYDSISLMYYNPRETTGYVRYVNSLNNEWRALQPDSDAKAKITVIPDATNETGAYTGWGNTSWSSGAYGFYTLYNTEMDENGDLIAADAQMITKEWNSYGIYVGTIQRTERLVTSGYIDIDTRGRTNLPTEDQYVLPYFVGDAPFYRVTSTSASDITLTPVNKYSDVQLDDEIIIVYNKAKNTVAYVVDLGSRSNYTAPEWLLNTSDYVANTNNQVKKNDGTSNDATSLYCKILWEQQNGQGTSTPIGDYTVTVKASYTDAQGVAQTKVLSTTGVAKNGQLTVTGIATQSADMVGYTNNIASGIKINGVSKAWTANLDASVSGKFDATLNTTVGGNANAVYLTNINTDIVIEVPYTINTNSISANVGAAGYGVSSVETQYTNAAGNKVGPDDAATGQAGIKYGTEVTIAVGLTSALATGQTVAPVVEKDGDPTTKVTTTFAGVDATGKYLYTFTMPDYDVKVSAKVALPEYTVTVAANDGIASTDAPAKTDWTANLVVTPTAESGYTVTGATAVVTGTTTVVTCDWDTANAGAATITAADGAGKNVTITFTTEKDAPVTEVTVAVDAGMTVTSVKAGQAIQLPGATSTTVPALAANGKVDLAGETSIWLMFTDATVTPDVTVTGSATATYMNKDTTNNIYTYQITGLTGGETITIVPAKATWNAPEISNIGVITAAGTDANLGYSIVNADPTEALEAISVIDTVADVNAIVTGATYGGSALALLVEATATAAPALSKADSDRWLVYVEANDVVSTTTSTIVQIGCVQIPTFADAATITPAPTVANDGKITATATAASGTSLKYAVVAAADKTTAEAAIATWSVATSEETIEAVTEIGSLTALVSGTTQLPDADSDKFLVVVEIDDTSGKLVAVNTVQLSTITN